MEKEILKISIEINASKERVWRVTLDDDTYRIWTSEFHPGSYAETDWLEGSKVYFKTPEGDGLVSRIITHIPNERISFEHLGILHDGKENYDAPEVKKWKGFTETYILTEIGRNVQLTIEQDISPSYAEQFDKIWKKALKKIKELSEAR